jgi:hypothetical protein
LELKNESRREIHIDPRKQFDAVKGAQIIESVAQQEFSIILRSDFKNPIDINQTMDLDLAMTFVQESAPEIKGEEILNHLRNGLDQFLHGNLTRDQIVIVFLETINCIKPLQRIEENLHRSQQPQQPSNNRQETLTPPPSRSRKKPHSWSLRENERLFAGIQQFGLDWGAIAEFVGNGRTCSQCSQRWSRSVHPSISHGRWTEAENQKLIGIVREMKKGVWSKIAKIMGNRSDVQCRYQFYQLKRNGKIPLDVLTTLSQSSSGVEIPQPLEPSVNLLLEGAFELAQNDFQQSQVEDWW